MNVVAGMEKVGLRGHLSITFNHILDIIECVRRSSGVCRAIPYAQGQLYGAIASVDSSRWVHDCSRRPNEVDARILAAGELGVDCGGFCGGNVFRFGVIRRAISGWLGRRIGVDREVLHVF